MRNMFWYLAAAVLGTASLANAQNLSDLQIKEEADFAHAIAAVEADPLETGLLEKFVRLYPASTHKAEAILAIEKAQLINTGTYRLFDMAEPSLSQLKPSRQYLQYFYQNQRDLYDYAEGKNIDIEAIRQKYLILAGMNDEEYYEEAQYYLGYCAYLQGNLEEAENRFSMLGSQTKYEPSITYCKMQMKYAKGDYAGAMADASTLRQFNQSAKFALNEAQEVELTRIEAECLMSQGKNKQAKAKYKYYLEQAKENMIVPSSAYNAALLAYQEGEYDYARQTLSKATGAKDATTRQSAYMLLGQCYLKKDEINQARMAFSQAANISNGDSKIKEAATYNVVSCVHQTTQSPWGDEVEMLENYLNEYPNSQYADRVSGYLVETYSTTRNYDAALQSIAKIKKPSQKILQAKQRLLTQQGLTYYVNGDYNAAVSSLSQSINLGNLDASNYQQALYWRGETYFQQGKYDQTVQDMFDFNDAKTSSTDPSLAAGAYYTLGYTRMQQKMYDKAITNFERYTSQPNQRGTATYTDALLRLGDCHYYNRNFPTAESYYKNAAASTQDEDRASYALHQEALMMGVQKKYANEQKALDELIRRFPQSGYADDAYLAKGRTSLLQMRNEEAIKSFQQVIAQYPESDKAPAAAVELAMTYNNMGRTDDAVKAYKKVAETYPGTEEAVTAIQDLKAIYLNRNDVDGFAQFLKTSGVSTEMSNHEQDSLNFVAAYRLLDEGQTQEAYKRMQSLTAQQTSATVRHEALPNATILAFNEKEYNVVIDNYQTMQKLGGYTASTMAGTQLLAAKSYNATGNRMDAIALLREVSADTRMQAGAEAKYDLAQIYYDSNQLGDAENTINEMLATGTPHAYWMARCVILLSDITAKRGDIFSSQEYLKSLRQNYTTDDDIQTMISSRLK